MSQLFTWDGQSTGVSASASVLPMNTQDWSPLGWTGWISWQSKGLLRVFSNTTVQKHQFLGAQLSSQSISHTLIITAMQTKGMRYYLTPTKMAIIKISTSSKYWSRYGKKNNPLSWWWECQLAQVPQKLKIELPYDPVVLLLGIYLDKTIMQKDTYTPVFIEALFTIAKTWIQHKMPIDRWMAKDVVYIYDGILLSHRKNDIMLYAEYKLLILW